MEHLFHIIIIRLCKYAIRSNMSHGGQDGGQEAQEVELSTEDESDKAM